MAGPGRPGDLEQALSVLETVVLCPGPDACPAKLPPAFHPWCCNSWRRMRRRQRSIFVKKYPNWSVFTGWPLYSAPKRSGKSFFEALFPRLSAIRALEQELAGG
ncbi:MAG: hypothetical protein R2875_16520 [Desulfobacterales bacterium]